MRTKKLALFLKNMEVKGKYHLRKSKGLCVQCGKEKENNNRVKCNKCAEKQRIYQRETREFYRNNGFCPECGKEKLFGKEKVCILCSAKKFEYDQKYKVEKYGSIKEGNRKRYQRRNQYCKENNLCRSCGKRKNAEGHTYCTTCLIKKRERGKEYRNKHENDGIPRSERPYYGLCYMCGEKLDNQESSFCTKCRERTAKNFDKVDRKKVPRIVYGKALNG